MKILTDILNLNVLELNSLIVALEFAFNLDLKENEKNDQIKKPVVETIDNITNNYEIILNSFDTEKKISVLKTIKTIFNLSLKEIKDILDSLPQTLKTTTNKKEAEEYKQKLEEAGGFVKIVLK